jgi:hypothetical protein
MKRMLVSIGLVTMLTPAAAGVAGAAPGGNGDGSPVVVCAYLRDNVPDAYEFLNTKPGACVSSIASVGRVALEEGAFPSIAAAIGNCKFLEATAFMDPAEPNPGGPYPYQFYWFGGSDPDQYTANNRAGCVKLLYKFHTGQLPPLGG